MNKMCPIVDGYYVWKKHEKYAFNEYFGTEELQCSCTHPECVEQKIVVTLGDRLRTLREAYKGPIKVNSGYRCHAKQEDLRAQGYETSKGISTHELGQAADICPAIKRDDPAWDFQIDKLYNFCDMHFGAVGRAKSFIHVDLRSGKIRWSYIKS